MNETNQGMESLEDRIIGHFDPDHDDEPQEAEEASETVEAEADDSDEPVTEEPSEEYEEVEYEGQSFPVPKGMREAFMRHEDYTQKTQSLADQRRNLEIQQKEIALMREQQAFAESVSAELDNLKMLDAYIQHTKANTNWAELSSDQIVRTRIELEQLADQRSELQKAIEGKYAEFQKAVDGKRNELRGQMEETLKKSIPQWSGETKSAIEQYVKSSGYPEIAVPNMTALDYQVAWKAMRYDQLQANKSKSVKDASKAPPIVKPGAVKRMAPETAKMLNFRKAMKKARNSSERAKLIEERMADKFG